ncbi:suppressor of SWI4 1 homolog isoform X2 [Microcaecilia unicolor]|uniref:Suppressor of SWI4 1 homolog isoform X2 n=1 Tax=Microcaecilia unicolor TaxID=1415580 RepID=A0A6P7XBK0_9AMPH|nr:suppressor of SWI4 1 homolog isoform X2 [Microcaecilia unicolor]
MGRWSKTKSQKKARANAVHTAQEEFSSVPHSFVFHRGQIGKMVQQLVLNVRQAMEPYTATSLKVQKKNTLKDFVSVVGPLGVTHFLIFSKTSENINFRLIRVPQGPTLTFRVKEYSLIKDVVSSLKHHRMHEQQFTHPPLLILNNFGLPGMHIKLMATMFQNLFPSINVHKINLNTIKRCILIHYDPNSQLISFRHYSLKVVPVGMSKGVKKLLQEKFPNMSRWEDISDLLAPGANLSESEAELDGEHNITELPQSYAGRGNMKAQQSAVRLTEIGPRMTLQLIKIEEGLNDGNVLYHSFVHKTEEELKAALERKEEKLRLKAERRKKQEQNVAQKKAQREDNKKKSLEGIRKKQQSPEEDSEVEDPGLDDQAAAAESEEDDDAEYYRQEVGQEPDEDLFPKSRKRKGAQLYRSPQTSKKFKAVKPGQRERSPSKRRDPQQPKFKKQRLLSSTFPDPSIRMKLGAYQGPRSSATKRGKGGPRSRGPVKGKGGPRSRGPVKGKGERGQAHQKRPFKQKNKANR